MPDLKIRIGAFNADSRSVPVTFTGGDIVHARDVNAVLKDDGSYDKAATKARVAEVAQGVGHKIAAGVIAAPSPDTASEPQPAE